jgi:hypothetical protein
MSKTIYENVNYEFVKIPEGFHFIHIYNQRNSFKIVLRATTKWLGSVIIAGSIKVDGSEDEAMINNIYSHDNNSWFEVDEALHDKVICLEHFANTTTVAICKTEEVNPQTTGQYQALDGNFTIPSNVGVYIAEGFCDYNGIEVNSKSYIKPAQLERNVAFSNAKCFLINTNEVQ